MEINIIGKRIKELREAKGITQKDLANALCVKRETVNQWENGVRDLKTAYTIQIADYFGVSCDYILRGVKSENISVYRDLGLTDKAISELEVRHAAGYLEVKTLDYLIGTPLFWNLIIRLNICIGNRIENNISYTPDEYKMMPINYEELPEFNNIEKPSTDEENLLFILQKSFSALTDKVLEDLQNSPNFEFIKERLLYKADMQGRLAICNAEFFENLKISKVQKKIQEALNQVDNPENLRKGVFVRPEISED